MSMPRPPPCAFYRTTGRNEPVLEWLKALPDGKRKQADRDIRWYPQSGDARSADSASGVKSRPPLLNAVTRVNSAPRKTICAT